MLVVGVTAAEFDDVSARSDKEVVLSCIKAALGSRTEAVKLCARKMLAALRTGTNATTPAGPRETPGPAVRMSRPLTALRATVGRGGPATMLGTVWQRAGADHAGIGVLFRETVARVFWKRLVGVGSTGAPGHQYLVRSLSPETTIARAASSSTTAVEHGVSGSGFNYVSRDLLG